MKQAYFRFCPRCAHPLKWRTEHRGEPKRQTCPNCSFTFYNNPSTTVDAIIIRGKNVLLVKRAFKPRRGYWDLPGGFLEAFEKPENGIRREVREELGVRFKLKGFVGAYPGSYRWQGRVIPTLALVYYGTHRGTVKHSDEINTVAWFPIHRAPRIMAFQHQRRAITELKRILSKP